MAAVPKKMRDIIKRKYDTCQLCGRRENNYIHFEIDHIIPRRFGGNNDENNLTLLCNICNTRKGSIFGYALERKKEMLMDKLTFLMAIEKMQNEVLDD